MSWRDARALSDSRTIFRRGCLAGCNIMRPQVSLRSVSTVTRIFARPLHTFNRPTSTIGRKHKAHRQQLQQGKNGRNQEKGRNKNRGKVGKHGRMGQEESRMVDEKTPPQTLKSRTLEAVAEYIRDGRARRIVVMVGALHAHAHTLPGANC